MTFRKYCQLIGELIAITVCKILFLPFARRNIDAVLPQHIMRQPYLLVANHRRGADPFIIVSGLPYRTFFKIAPINFMTANVFYDSLLRPFMWLLGCFPARNPKGAHKLYGVDGSARLLASGFSVLIFPEGTRVRDDRGPAKPGVIRIHQALPDVPIIIARIHYGKKISLTYHVITGERFKDAEQLMNRVFMLH